MKSRWSPQTKSSYEASLKLYQRLCARWHRPLNDPQSLAVFIMARVRDGISHATIKKDVVAVRQLQPGLEDSVVIQHALQAAARLADVPKKSKLPLTMQHMKKLGQVIAASQDKDYAPRQRERMKLRDWTYFLMAFVGFFRGSELVELHWSDLEWYWRSPSSEVSTTYTP